MFLYISINLYCEDFFARIKWMQRELVAKKQKKKERVREGVWGNCRIETAAVITYGHIRRPADEYTVVR